MLTITVPACEYYDEKADEFRFCKEQILCLEHSLVSISKWESKWHKPFLSKDKKTAEETLDYIRCMTLTQNVNPDVYNFLTADNIKEIENYIDDPMTATWFNEEPNSPKSRNVVTAEIIYYWMIGFNIPFECQKWHLNRLLTLIRVCNIKSAPPKKMGRQETMSRNTALNAARRKALKTRG